MEPSAELKKAVLRLYESLSMGDANAFQRLFSSQSGLLFIGSDPNEWWPDRDTVTQALKAQLQVRSNTPISAGELTAYVEGTVGWAADQHISD